MRRLDDPRDVQLSVTESSWAPASGSIGRESPPLPLVSGAPSFLSAGEQDLKWSAPSKRSISHPQPVVQTVQGGLPTVEETAQRRELLALRRRCADLEERLAMHRTSPAALQEVEVESAPSVAPMRSAPPVMATVAEEELARLRGQLDRALRAEEAEAEKCRQASAQEREASDRLLTQAEEAAARLAAVEARLADEEVLRERAEQGRREALEEAAQGARKARGAALVWGEACVRASDDSARHLALGAWRLQAQYDGLENRMEIATAQRLELATELGEAESERAAAEAARRLAVRRASLAEAAAAEEAAYLRVQAAAAEARQKCADALRAAAVEEQERAKQEAADRVRNAEAAATEQQARHRSELASQAAAAVRDRELALRRQADAAEDRFQQEAVRCGAELREANLRSSARLREASAGSPDARETRGASLKAPAIALIRSKTLSSAAAWACYGDRAGLLAAFAAWRTVVDGKREVSVLQARLFTEEAGRMSALRAQKMDLDTRYMEAEAKHRSALHRLRAEIAEAEKRHADALAVQDADHQQRLALAEADFSLALQNGEDAAASAPWGSVEDIPGEEALDTAAALRTLRERAEQRLNDVEARQEQALQSERERADLRMAREERRHDEALRSVRDAADRRLAALEARHTEALEELQDEADRRLLDAESRHAQLLALLQAESEGSDQGPAAG